MMDKVNNLWLALAAAAAMGGCSANLHISATGRPVVAASRPAGEPRLRRVTTSGPTARPPAARAGTTALITASGHLSATIEIFSEMSRVTGGVHVQSAGAQEVPQNIAEVLERAVPVGVPVDLVFVVDTTGSMEDDIHAAQAEMRTILARLTRSNPDRRVGVVGYRDRGDEYLTSTFLQLDTHEASIIHAIDSLKVAGGGDRPEHVYAGLSTALAFQPWRPHASQHIVLMGDAPPHENRAGGATKQSVLAQARTSPRNVAIHTIGLRCDDCAGVIAEKDSAR